MTRLLFMLVLGAGMTFPAVKATELTTGERVFRQWCIHCHGDDNSGPGTLRLAWDKGEDKSLLTERADLGREYIRFVVRRGLDEMPSFRITEISEAELKALAEFLGR